MKPTRRRSMWQSEDHQNSEVAKAIAKVFAPTSRWAIKRCSWNKSIEDLSTNHQKTRYIFCDDFVFKIMRFPLRKPPYFCIVHILLWRVFYIYWINHWNLPRRQTHIVESPNYHNSDCPIEFHSSNIVFNDAHELLENSKCHHNVTVPLHGFQRLSNLSLLFPTLVRKVLTCVLGSSKS